MDNNKQEFNQEAFDNHMREFCKGAAQRGLEPKEPTVALGLGAMLEELDEFMIWLEKRNHNKT